MARKKNSRELKTTDYRHKGQKRPNIPPASIAVTPDASAPPLAIAWEMALDDERLMPVNPDEEPDLVADSPRHLYAAFDVEGHTVHVDWLTARRRTPIFAFVEYRVFVNGRLEERGGRMQVGLGAPCNVTARALVTPDHLVVIDDPVGHPVDQPGVVGLGRPAARDPLVPPFIVTATILTAQEYSRLPADLRGDSGGIGARLRGAIR
jgi:hypothetical protein